MRKTDLHQRNTWTVGQAAEWAQVPTRTMYKLLRDGVVPSIPMGACQTQQLPGARDGKRRRTCYRYLIPRAAFVKAWENLGIDKTAA
jgi:hypothetical protein